MYYQRLLLVLPALLISSASAQQDSVEYRSFLNLEYGQVDDRSLHLDLYVPKSTEPLPLIIWVHGGAWRQGDKRLSPGRISEVVSRGYALASVQYRFSQEAQFPAQIVDCQNAVCWLRENASKYGIDPDRFGAWGASAGGHLVAMLGTASDVDAWAGDRQTSCRVQAVCDWFGPTDFLQMNTQGSRMDHDAADSPESQLVGGLIQQNPDRVKAANPMTYITADDPPILIMHGDQDPLVPFGQSVIFHEALQNVGVDATLYRVRDGGHGGKGFLEPAAAKAIWDFFDRHLSADR